MGVTRQSPHSPESRAGRLTGGERRSLESRSAARTVPGFGTHFTGHFAARCVRPIPGFRAQTYRDLGHSSFSNRVSADTGISGTLKPFTTGISGTPLPGFRARNHRDLGHGGTGIWDTNESLATGISGTNPDANHSKTRRIAASNFDLLTRSKNTTTRRCLFFGRGGAS